MNTILKTVPAVLLLAARAAAAPLDDGLRLIRSREYPAAIKVLEKEARSNPGSPEVLLNLGWAYWHADRVDEAWRIADTLVKIDGDNPTFLLFLANMDIEKGSHQKALEAASRVLKSSPENRDALMILSKALFRLQRREEAISVLERVLKRHPDYAEALHRKAVFLAEMGQSTKSLLHFDNLVRSDPGNSTYRKGRAKALYDVGRVKEAKAEWQRLARKEPDAESLLNLGWAYWHDKDYEGAWRIGSTLMRLDDGNPAFLRFMANMEIERMNYAEALRLAQKAARLAPEDRDVSLVLAKSLFRLQREKEAMEILGRLLKEHPDNAAVRFYWADFSARMGDHETALAHLDRLLEADPANDAYRMNRAHVLYESGQFAKAVSEWRVMVSRSDPHPDALVRLRDDAFNRRDWAEALRWQEKIIATKPSEPAAWEKLSAIQTAMGRDADALKSAERAIEIDPVGINPYYLKAEALGRLADWPAAQKAYEEILRRNPNSYRAFDGLSFALEGQRDYAGALKILKEVERVSYSSSPYLPIRRARLLADQGKLGEALALLEKITRKRERAIPALLYHGISRHDRSESIPQRAFREQMEELKRLGYESLTVSEFEKHLQGTAPKPLPEKPVLITFDDGRTDSFENADPVLESVGYRATMFVHLSKLRKPHFHSNPEDMRRWRATGRWELQSHGQRAHDPMPIDVTGRIGHFLANRMWLEKESRLETLAEYRARLEEDYRAARRGVEEITGSRVTAFAYPYGDFGQADYTNTPESAAINQELAKRYFRLAFVQEYYGINTLSSTPTDLKRYEVPRHMEARQLSQRIALLDPWVQAKVVEASIWHRRGKPWRASRILAELRRQGVEAPVLLAQSASAIEKTGNAYEARKSYDEAYALQPGERGFRILLDQQRRRDAPKARIEIQRLSDSLDNVVKKDLARLAGSAGPLQLQGSLGRGHYLSPLLPGRPPASDERIEVEELGGGARVFPLPRLELNASYTRRLFMGGAAHVAHNYGGDASLQTSDVLRVTARGEKGNVETAAGIRERVDYKTLGGGLAWDMSLDWTASADYDRVRYNDGNDGDTVRLQAARTLPAGFSLGYSFKYADSSRPTNAYFTPRNLRQHEGVLAFRRSFGSPGPRTGSLPFEAKLQYRPGYGWADNRDSALHSVAAALTWRILENISLSGTGQYAQSPNYISRQAVASLGVSF